MKNFELRQRLSRTTLIRTVAPALMGGAILLSSSCSNVREFAGKPFHKDVPVANSEAKSDAGGVKHAYAAKSEKRDEKDGDFIKLLQFKMQDTEGKVKEDRLTTEVEQTSVQDIIAAGEDPFLNSPPITPPPVADHTQLTQTASKPAPIPSQPEVVQAELEAPVARPFVVDQTIQLTSAEEIQNRQLPTAGDPVSFAPEPRVACEIPLACPPFQACPSPAVDPYFCFANVKPFPTPEIVGDECIHDGGDLGTKVYYTDSTRHGLNVEDTVVEWRDDLGVAHVKPSTRVCIYAPRFAAVRSVSLPHEGVIVNRLAGHQDRTKVAGIDTQLVIDEKVHNDEAVAMLMRSRPSGLEAKSTDTAVHQTVNAQKHVKLLNVYEDFLFFRDGQIARVNSAIIGEAIEAAIAWNGDRGVVIYAHDQAGQEVQGRFTSQDYTVVEDRSKPGDLTIVKIVDKTVAKPGDELTFTIRFDNTGDRPLQNVRVVDNLSPRLKYIDGSVDSNRDGKLDTEDNQRGSQVLSFTFDGELKGHTGGWISFKCIVR